MFDFPWVDSFAAARNECLRHATGEWILWLDADDRLDEANRDKLRALLDGLGDENVAFVMKCVCVAKGSVDQDAGVRTPRHDTEVDHVRLFRNLPGLSWKYRVHEQILPALKARRATVRWSDVVIHHIGYQDPAVRAKKLERDLRLLELDRAEHPDDPFILFNLGSIYQEQGKLADAIPYLKRSLGVSRPADSIVRKLYALLAQTHNLLGQSEEALTACRSGRVHYPDDIEILFQEGLVRQQLGDKAGAKACWEQVLATPPGAHFASVNAGIRGPLTRHNLATVCRELGELAAAEAHWRHVTADDPEFTLAWRGLGELYLAQERWPALEQVCAALERTGNGKLPAGLLRARAFLKQKEFNAARGLLGELIEQFPTSIEARQVLSHAHLQEGRDLAAAERALHDILGLDPENGEARHNLAVLLRQRAS